MEQKLYSDSAHDPTSGFCNAAFNGEDLKKTESSNGLSSKDLEMLAPSSSQDQLSSMIAFSPNWKYMGSEVEVILALCIWLK
ncbi:hypothetical protein Patl1_12389 [Pistacia atlantica]|uniref:Uncharacterized protein n=1 Tax=Pistacia atlantica TaxID=434234 RepID=A0ACC1A4H9_9ROSI|nr:hypothetical protein Patl1_12389 [Pistacia atlantica]